LVAGLALQGMLANYAAGFTIIIARPFVVVGTLNVQIQTGLVETMHLTYTILVHEDAVRIEIPNRLSSWRNNTQLKRVEAYRAFRSRGL
jgi:small conductance mechanosensitive channel